MNPNSSGKGGVDKGGGLPAPMTSSYTEEVAAAERTNVCPNCGGEGVHGYGRKMYTCSKCKGSGVVSDADAKDDLWDKPFGYARGYRDAKKDAEKHWREKIGVRVRELEDELKREPLDPLMWFEKRCIRSNIELLRVLLESDTTKKEATKE